MSAPYRLELYPIDTVARARLVDAWTPGSRVVHARRLRGGLGATTQVLTIEDAAGGRTRAVLRVYLPGRVRGSPERARREFRTIALVHAAGVPASQPLFLDAEGEHLGRPAMLLSYLPGHSLYVPQDLHQWTDGLARAIVAVNSIRPGDHDLSWLPRYDHDRVALELDNLRARVGESDDALGRDALAVLDKHRDAIEWLPPCLVHEDFWAGNTVWYRGRLTGVIDWSDACLGDPRLDLPQCCVDAQIAAGREVADELRAAHARIAGRLPQQWYFDLLLGLKALVYHEIWLIGYHDAGLTWLTKELVRERIEQFVDKALDEAP